MTETNPTSDQILEAKEDVRNEQQELMDELTEHDHITRFFKNKCFAFAVRKIGENWRKSEKKTWKLAKKFIFPKNSEFSPKNSNSAQHFLTENSVFSRFWKINWIFFRLKAVKNHSKTSDFRGKKIIFVEISMQFSRFSIIKNQWNYHDFPEIIQFLTENRQKNTQQRRIFS